MQRKKLHFVVVAVDGSIASAVYGPLELLLACKRMQDHLPELAPCDISWEVLSPGGKPFSASSGYTQPVDGALKDLPEHTVIFFPGFGLVPADELPALLEQHAPLRAWLERQHAAGHTIAASCNGNFLLVECGLFPRKRATTSWIYAEAFRQRYPHVELDLDAVLIEDERVLSMGGVLCGLDMMLSLIERFIGREVARLVAKVLVLENRRPSELTYEKRQPVVHNDPLIDRTVNWIRSNLHARLTVDDVLRQVPTSRRNLSRRFKLETGEALQSFIQRMRIDRAKLLLETSDMPIEQILVQVGYQDKSAFARQFKRHTKLTPNEYRERNSLSHAG